MTGDLVAFQWKLYDGGEWRWSRGHVVEGPCPACCCNGPGVCPDCGGRSHREPVEVMGGEIPHTSFCQQERVDDDGDGADVREVAIRHDG